MFRKIVYTIICTLICWFLVGAVIGAVWGGFSGGNIFISGLVYICYPIFGPVLIVLVDSFTIIFFILLLFIYISIPIGVIYVLNKINSIKSRKNID